MYFSFIFSSYMASPSPPAPYINVRFFHKQIYLFMDRSNKADDNGEHLFKYAMQQNDGIKKYFALQVPKVV